MKVFAISDLHLSTLVDKPMNVFGKGWENHFEKIKANWQDLVEDGDIVLLCGDLSWGMTLDEAVADMNLLAPLKGEKVFIRGNHDFWWSAIGKVRDRAPDKSFHFLQNDCIKFDDIVICGSRGWSCPGSQDFTEQDKKIYLRETERFKLCKKEVAKVRGDDDKLIIMCHFPPFPAKFQENALTSLFEEMKADKVVFGHIHGDIWFPKFYSYNGVDYILSSCDKINFSLVRIL